jgi:pyruvate,water dikinase
VLSKGTTVAEKWLFWLDEIGQGHNDLVGKKCANLGEIYRIGLLAPPGFALAVEAYNKFLTETGAIQELRQYLSGFSADPQDARKYQEAANVTRQIVESKEMLRDIEDTIASYYDALCQRCGIADVAVAVRSAGTASHPGQYETYLNVKGKTALMERIIKVWSSTFNARSLISRARQGLPLESDPIGVAVLKMVNARCAGICFTADPNSGDKSKITIEANWGLGESVVGGMVVPDRWTLDKGSLAVLEKRLGEKRTQIALCESGVREEEIPPERRSIFCLTDEEATRIGQLGKILESHFEVPQDLEWAIDCNSPCLENVLLLQTRPEVIKNKKGITYQILEEILKGG